MGARLQFLILSSEAENHSQSHEGDLSWRWHHPLGMCQGVWKMANIKRTSRGGTALQILQALYARGKNDIHLISEYLSSKSCHVCMEQRSLKQFTKKSPVDKDGKKIKVDSRIFFLANRRVASVEVEPSSSTTTISTRKENVLQCIHNSNNIFPITTFSFSNHQ